MRIHTVLLLLSCATGTMAQQSWPPVESIRGAVSGALNRYLQKIPAGNESAYGFSSRAEFSRVNVGMPLQVFTLRNDSLTGAYDPKRNYLVANDCWRVPLHIDGQARCLMTVVVRQSLPVAVDLGAMHLASELDECIKANPTGKHGILRLHTLGCDLLIVDAPDRPTAAATFVPLQSARPVFGITGHPSGCGLDRSAIMPRIVSRHNAAIAAIKRRRPHPQD